MDKAERVHLGLWS